MRSILLLLFLCGQAMLPAQAAIYQYRDDARSRWVSFENPTGAPGAGGPENRGAKGHAWEPVAAGETKTLLDAEGSGIIHRIWLTVQDRSPEMLRSMRIDMYWDGAAEPAVSAPLGDFFGVGLGRMDTFENALFASPEGRSFVAYVPMPFRTGARITVTNESDRTQGMLYYDINYSETDAWDADNLYLHAHWRRDTGTAVGEDYVLLPPLTGRGRFLGVNAGVVADSAYRGMWWGEGEVKIYLDGDAELPTLIGTGTEDYIGTGWGQGAYANRYQGATVADQDRGLWCFYRYHVPDPVYFHASIRAELQVISGGMVNDVLDLYEAPDGPPVIPVSVNYARQLNLLDTVITDYRTLDPGGWMNFYRSDDYSSTAYFYLDRPTNGLPPLPEVALRTVNLAGAPQVPTEE